MGTPKKEQLKSEQAAATPRTGEQGELAGAFADAAASLLSPAEFALLISCSKLTCSIFSPAGGRAENR